MPRWSTMLIRELASKSRCDEYGVSERVDQFQAIDGREVDEYESGPHRIHVGPFQQQHVVFDHETLEGNRLIERSDQHAAVLDPGRPIAKDALPDRIWCHAFLGKRGQVKLHY
jgi:hypothetical protein